ncbi:MAG: EamA family transporter [Candidatus Limnocylindrales bacterium]
MPAVALVLVIIAAVLHAGWNVLLKTSGDPLRSAVRLQAIGTAILVPIGIVAWLVSGRPGLPAEGVALAVVSGLLEAAYFICLSAAYSRGDLSLVYPLARGSAPLLAIVIGLGLLGERLAPLAGLGVACLVVGILVVARPWRVLQAAGREHRGAVGWALATGATIAAYSAVDRLGVRTMEPWLYGSVLAVCATTILATAVAVGRRRGLVSAPPAGGRAPSLVRDGVAGGLSLTAYLLILFAYSLAPLAAVAPLRESGIVIAAAWGAIRLGESSGGRESLVRIGAAALVVLGAVLLAIAR